jgi:purine nucleosidase
MNRLIIDTDPGVDDAQAIMLAAAHPDTRIEALTTVAGNVSLEQTTANACKILDLLELEIPVYAGCDRPLVASYSDARHVHGDDGLGNSGYPPSQRQPSGEHAAEALVGLASESPGELTLAAVGPLTNLAVAVRLDPELPKKFKRLVVMGGAVRGMGNVTPAAEFNIYTDPEAAAIVFQEWPALTLLSWETTVAHGFSERQVEELFTADSRRGEFFRRISTASLDFMEHFLGRRELLIPDGLALAVSMEPDIITKAENHQVQVELAGEHTRGATVVDWFDLTGKESKVEIVLELDSRRVFELFQAAVK